VEFGAIRHGDRRLGYDACQSGTVFAPMALPIFAIAAVEVPSAVILSRSIGVEGIWAAYPITFTAMFILQMSYYMLVWRRRTVQRLI
jgi:Na+-driven multidrug efflux pump